WRRAGSTTRDRVFHDASARHLDEARCWLYLRGAMAWICRSGRILGRYPGETRDRSSTAGYSQRVWHVDYVAGGIGRWPPWAERSSPCGLLETCIKECGREWRDG